MTQRPSNAFIGAAWVGLFTGGIAYCIGLWNSSMALSEKGYYFTILMYGLYSVVSLQKAVRDQIEGIRVTALYNGISWFSTVLSLLLLVIGLWNASLMRSEKGFFAMSFVLSLFAAVAVQKNIRDMQIADIEDAKNKPDVQAGL